jgi:hypothetical protein
MIWSGAMVPTMGPIGWLTLGTLIGIFAMSRRCAFPAAGMTVALVAVATVPLAAVAAQIVLPYSFSNGTVADAIQVNDNFATLEVESNDQDARISDLEGPDFTSAWTAVGANSEVSISHGLGTIPTRVTIQVASSATPSTVHMGGYIWKNLDSEGGRGTIVTDMTTTQLKVRTGNSPVCAVYDTYIANTSSNRICLHSGYARVLVWD